MPCHLLRAEARSQELVARRRRNPVKAWKARRGARNAHMHLARAGVAHHVDYLHRGRAAHDRIVDEDYPLAFEIGAVGIVLEAHAEMADLVGRLDKGAPDIMVANNPELE